MNMSMHFRTDVPTFPFAQQDLSCILSVDKKQAAKSNQIWDSLAVVLLTRTNRNSKCSFSAVGCGEKEENRKAACIFVC